MIKLSSLLGIACGLFLSTFLFAQDGYQTPPADIAALAEAPLTPRVSINNSGEWMLLMERPGYPSIEELAQPELRLAGLRINPRTNGASRSGSYNGLRLKNISSGREFPAQGLPESPRIENVSWSPDGSQIAFTVTQADGLELWLLTVATQQAARLMEEHVNDAGRGLPYSWLPDNRTILVRTVPGGRGEAPQEDLTPSGPVIQATQGGKAPVRTYQDLLKNPHDEDLFDYYMTSHLAMVDIHSQEVNHISQPGIFTTVSPSPDGNYVLLGRLHKPYSYQVPYSRFPVSYSIVDRTGKIVSQLADIPLAENIPKGFGAVRTGPRNFAWRSDKPSTVYWVEAQDGGDPSMETEVRDQLFSKSAPFTGKPSPGIRFALRYGGVIWGNDDLAVGYEWWWTTRQQIASRFDPDDAYSRTVLFEGSFEDRYNDPGNLVTETNDYGRSVLMMNDAGNQLYLTGQGASPEGDRPFLRSVDLNTLETTELWRSSAPHYEFIVEVLDPEAGTVVTRRESKTERPNYYLRNLETEDERALTTFPHPYPALEGIEKQVVQYVREDGVQLQGDLYLPKDYHPLSSDPLPVLMWAYPSEYKSADAAGQVEGSPYEFIRLYWGSPLYWLTQGYAVLDDPGMPVIGEGEEEPNDTFREQLVANAQAAVTKLVDMGIADPDRIAIGGHSYGAFMTANLLAHSDLFAAGIARSGAYNRTLTPFGFQAEERTYWDAPEVYYTMSPFMHADKVNEPLLMIHGAADNNSGTFPMQSERFYAAVKGLGGTVRLVMLPHESHGYRARESILHTLWEQHQWLEEHVKQRVEP